MGRNLLVLVDPCRDAPSVLADAALRARATRARLTVLGVWRPHVLLRFSVFADHDPRAFLESQGDEVAAWLRASVSKLPDDVGVITVCRRGRLLRELNAELELRHYDELLLPRGTRPRALKRLTRHHPGLSILVADSPGDTARPLLARWRSPETVGEPAASPQLAR